jgi:UDP-galactopyranose mutase
MTAPPPRQPLTIVNLCHLAWERKLFQRPQQLATRFAEQGVLFSYFALIGFRRYMDMKLQERVLEPREGLLAQNLPFMPLTKYFGFMESLTLALFHAKAAAPLRRAPKGRRVLWIQNPAYHRAIDRIPHDLLVYDVMDPYKEFSAAGGLSEEHENRVLSKADLVFTGGRSLHTLVADRHSDVHCFPSGIDFEHFAKGAQDGPVAKDVAGLSKPVLGYFGAVDERIDWPLIQHLCRERRHWSVVFLGPLVLMDKVPISEPNFHYLGPKPYERLPEYLRAFDVCLIPWLVNNLTKYMSPTKTPEYLAAGRPVVSTPIPDVMADYSQEALVASTPQEFVAACTTALMRGTGPAAKPPQSRTWDETAARMLELIEDRLARKG